MALKAQTFTKTPFKKQADVIAAILRTNPIINDDEKTSLNETVGVLTWLNQLQLFWAEGGQGIPEHIEKQIFIERHAQKITVPEPS